MTFLNALSGINGEATTPTEFFPDAETFMIAAEVCPGQAELLDATKKFGWQINQGWGLTGATVVPKGDELVVAKFAIRIWDEVTDWPAFIAFRKKYLLNPAYRQTGSAKPKSLGISYPELAALGVTEVVVLSLSAVKNDGLGLHECEVEFLQFRAPKPALARPDASIPPKGAPTPTAQDAAQREMQGKQAEIDKLWTQINGGP